MVGLCDPACVVSGRGHVVCSPPRVGRWTALEYTWEDWRGRLCTRLVGSIPATSIYEKNIIHKFNSGGNDEWFAFRESYDVG